MTAPTTSATPKIALDQRAPSRHDNALESPTRTANPNLPIENGTTVFQPYRECDNSEERNNKNESHCRNQNIHGALSRQAP
jgi:hypothetical protein